MVCRWLTRACPVYLHGRKMGYDTGRAHFSDLAQTRLDQPPLLENQMEKNRENEMETLRSLLLLSNNCCNTKFWYTSAQTWTTREARPCALHMPPMSVLVKQYAQAANKVFEHLPGLCKEGYLPKLGDFASVYTSPKKSWNSRLRTALEKYSGS